MVVGPFASILSMSVKCVTMVILKKTQQILFLIVHKNCPRIFLVICLWILFCWQYGTSHSWHPHHTVLGFV